MKNHYFITLHLYIGDFEKSTDVIIAADSPSNAAKIALEGECHERPIFNKDPEVCEDGMTGMTYEVASCQLIPQEDLAVLRKWVLSQCVTP